MAVNRKWSSWNNRELVQFCFETGDPRLKRIMQGESETDSNGDGRENAEVLQRATWDPSGRA